jgi:hypothetical protein
MGWYTKPNDMSENISESFNRLSWHDSKLRSIRIARRDDLDEVVLDVELRGISKQELTPMTVVLEEAVFFFSDIDLQGKRECADDISSAACKAESDLMTKLQNERLKHSSPHALAGYFHFQVYLIPPGGTLDVIASGFRLEAQGENKLFR